MNLSRRGVLGGLAAAPVVAPAMAKAHLDTVEPSAQNFGATIRGGAALTDTAPEIDPLFKLRSAVGDAMHLRNEILGTKRHAERSAAVGAYPPAIANKQSWSPVIKAHYAALEALEMAERDRFWLALNGASTPAAVLALAAKWGVKV